MSTAGTIVIGGDLTVNRLGFGAMRLSGPGIWGDPPDREAALRVLQRAVELGVSFIDTADAYGPETNEQLIADALHPYPAGLVIGTKGGIVRPSPERWERDGRPSTGVAHVGPVPASITRPAASRAGPPGPAHYFAASIAVTT